MKLCPTCEQHKARDDFSKNSTKPDGLQYACRECCRRAKAASSAPLGEKAKRYQKAYRNLWRYGLSACEFARLRIQQMDRCAVCDADEKLNIDHCHDTGTVRGLLCGNCNRGLGQFRDDLERMRSAVRYLENHISSLTSSGSTGPRGSR